MQSQEIEYRAGRAIVKAVEQIAQRTAQDKAETGGSD
jgi:hypothetical protein